MLEEDHYYPFGLTLNTSEMNMGVNQQPYKYQRIELEQHFGLQQYESFYRTIDPQLGLIQQPDPKAENHYEFSPYVSMGDNPVKNVDPMGDDWFVNNRTGDLVFFKGSNKIEQQRLESIANVNHNTSDYERLGADNVWRRG